MSTTNPIAELVGIYQDQMIEKINSSIKQNSLGDMSRLFNETTLRGGTLTTSLSLINSAANTPPVDPEIPEDAIGETAVSVIEASPQLKLWYRQLKHQAATALFDQDGKLQTAIKTQLSPAISSAYAHFGEEKVNHKLLVSYCLSFVFAQSVEANPAAYQPSFGADDMPVAPGTLNAQQQMTQALNFEANQTGSLNVLCAAAHAEKSNQILKQFQYTQACAKTAHSNTLRFLLANRALNLAITEQLPKNYSADDLGDAYRALVQKTGKIDLPARAAERISQLCNGLTNYTYSAESRGQPKKIQEAAQAMYAVRFFLNTATTNKPNSRAKPSRKAVNKYLKTVTTGNLYKEWLADSRLGLLNFRILAKVRVIDKHAKKISKLEQKHASDEELLAQFLNLKQVTDAWVDVKKEKYKDGIPSQSRLPGGLKLQTKINTKIASLAAIVHKEKLENYNTKQAKAKHSMKVKTVVHPELLAQVAKRTQKQLAKKQVEQQHGAVMKALPSHHFFSQQQPKKQAPSVSCLNALVTVTMSAAHSAINAISAISFWLMGAQSQAATKQPVIQETNRALRQ